MRFFENKGYSDEFIKHMEDVVRQLNNNPKVLIVLRCDAICTKCKHNIDNNCETFDKVCKYDKKVCDVFSIKEGDYQYNDINKMIEDKLNSQTLKEICQDCEWYSICKKKV